MSARSSLRFYGLVVSYVCSMHLPLHSSKIQYDKCFWLWFQYNQFFDSSVAMTPKEGLKACVTAHQFACKCSIKRLERKMHLILSTSYVQLISLQGKANFAT